LENSLTSWEMDSPQYLDKNSWNIDEKSVSIIHNLERIIDRFLHDSANSLFMRQSEEKQQNPNCALSTPHSTDSIIY
jgi:hypothetical protein